MYNQNMPGQNIRGNMPPGARPMGNQYIRNAQPMIFRPNMQRMPAHMMNQNMLGMRGQMHPGFNPNQPGAPPGHPAQNMPGHPNPNMPNAPNLGHHNNLPNQGHFGNNLPHPQNNMPNNNNNSSAGNAGASGNLPNNPLKRRNGDRNLPDDIAVLIPESKSYKSLLAIENKIDKQISWKRLEIQETLKKPLKTRRKLRVFITTQYTPGKRINAPNLDAAGNNQQQKNEPGSWELRVEGKLADKKGIDHNKKRKFSSFFESLVIELDKEIYGPEQHLVEWHREKQNNETDGFQVKRPGDKDVRCTMLFMMHHSPEKCKLDIQLGKLLGIYIGTRAEILYNLWAYIRNNKLQDPNQKDVINLDPYLIRIFQVTQMRFSEIPHRIQQFMHKPDPMAIHHRIKCDVNDPKKTAIYDLDVDIDDITNHNMKMFLNSTNNNEKLNKLDNQIIDIISNLKTTKLKHEFFDDFANEPQAFIDKWLASQSLDLKTVKGEHSGKMTDDQRKSEYYSQPWMDQAVNRYFFNRLNESRLELEQAMYQKNK